MSRSVSVIVNSNGRAVSLGETLASLRALDTPDIEVVVVTGPDDDGVSAVRSAFGTDVIWRSCPERNLSMSRNIGIAAASGDLVAFIDDDAVPDPGWLIPIVAAFDDPEVAGAGGPVFDHTGGRLQTRYNVVTRGGKVLVQHDGPNPTEIINAPDSWAIPSLIGTNSCFRRDLVVLLGGFDEEYEYYFDETDLCARLVDRGWKIVMLDEGFVYHRYLPSHLRTSDRVVSDWYPVIKNLTYFVYRYGVETGGLARVAEDMAEYIRGVRESVAWQVEVGISPVGAEERLEEVLATAPDVGRRLAEAGARRTRPPAFFDIAGPFGPFATARPAGRRLHVCFLTQEYPPGPVSGIGRVIHELAVGLAERGHVIRVLTKGGDHLTVDLEEGAWVHRVPVDADADADARSGTEPREPRHVWRHAAAMARELRRIEAIRPVDVVQIPNWDSEGAAVLEDGGWITSLGMYTPLATLCAVDERVDAADPEIAAMIDLERSGYLEADALLACGMPIVEEVERAYDITIDRDRLSIVPHGLPDTWTKDAPGESDAVEILFVGRLEPRKGVDTLLEAVGPLLSDRPDVRLTFAGDDSQRDEAGRSYAERLDRLVDDAAARRRVTFAGLVDDDELARLYERCDIVVVPSRYESFGLTAIEGMMRAKPVVASRVGGLAEIVDEGVTGWTVPHSDAEALRRALERLVASPGERRAMGLSGRARFEERYSRSAMAAAAEEHYLVLAGDRREEESVRRSAA